MLLVPGLVTADECAAMVADVEAHREAAAATAKGECGRERFMLSELDAETQRTFEQVLRGRLLPLISRELPAVVDMIWARSMKAQRTVPLAECPLIFSAQEPAINRYAAGGRFEPHVDKLALTINVLLADGCAFAGGGTQFWRQGGDADGVDSTGGGGGAPAAPEAAQRGVAPPLRQGGRAEVEAEAVDAAEAASEILTEIRIWRSENRFIPPTPGRTPRYLLPPHLIVGSSRRGLLTPAHPISRRFGPPRRRRQCATGSSQLSCSRRRRVVRL